MLKATAWACATEGATATMAAPASRAFLNEIAVVMVISPRMRDGSCWRSQRVRRASPGTPHKKVSVRVGRRSATGQDDHVAPLVDRRLDREAHFERGDEAIGRARPEHAADPHLAQIA